MKEEKGRKFVSNAFADSMFDKVKDGKTHMIPVLVPLSELKDPEIISVVRDPIIVNSLRERGIYVDLNESKITLIPGDVIYVINPGIKLNMVKGDVIPPTATMTVTKWRVVHYDD